MANLIYENTFIHSLPISNEKCHKFFNNVIKKSIILNSSYYILTTFRKVLSTFKY